MIMPLGEMTEEEKKEYIKAVEQFRKEKDEFFRQGPQSPLTPEQRQAFKGLKYYPVDPKYRIITKLIKLDDPEIIEIPTTGGSSQHYIKFGKITFAIDDQNCELIIFQSTHDNHLFLPFRDATAGKETYGAGRYVEVELLEDDTCIVDFNLAYNPYCAYNDNWVCPMTPFENYLNCEIKAGEKKFKEE